MNIFKQYSYLTLSSFLALIVLYNIYFLQSSFVGLLFASLFLLLQSIIIGTLIKPNESVWHALFYGSLAYLGSVSILLSIVYYLSSYSVNHVAMILIATPFLVHIAYKKYKIQFFQFERFIHFSKPRINLQSSLLISVYVVFLIYVFTQFLWARTDQSITSPWNSISPNTFIAYFISTLLLIVIFFKTQISKATQFFLLFLHFFSTLSVATIVYRLGFGYDPFLHRAAMEHINTNGFIEPKNPYYIGMYTLELFLHAISAVSIFFIDTFLIPLATSILIPAILLICYEENKNNIAAVMGLIFLSIPLAGFTNTTPQSLANLLAITSILLLHSKKGIFIPFLLSLTTLFIHPLTGAPLFLFVLWYVVAEHAKKNLQNIFPLLSSILYFLLGLLTIPLLFLLQTVSQGNIQQLLHNLPNANLNFLTIELPRRVFHILPDIVYLIGVNQTLIALVIAVAGVYMTYKSNAFKSSAPFFLMALGLFLSIPLAQITAFHPDIIQYEQGVYSERILQLILYFLLPFYLLAWSFFIASLQNYAAYVIRISSILVLSGMISISFFFAYPRDNHIEIGRFHSLSQSDIDAVHTIADQTKNEYIVISNQMMSAAAVQEFGFDHNYNGRYFYAIPTGAELYKTFLAMVYEEPSREKMQKAADLSGVKEAYFAIHDYWQGSSNIVEKIATQADEVIKLPQEDIHVFKYQFE